MPDPCDGRTLRGRPTAATRCIRCHRAVASEILHTTFIDYPSSMLMRWSASLLLPTLGDRTGSPRPGHRRQDRTSLVGKGQATPENGCEPPSGSQSARPRRSQPCHTGATHVIHAPATGTTVGPSEPGGRERWRASARAANALRAPFRVRPDRTLGHPRLAQTSPCPLVPPSPCCSRPLGRSSRRFRRDWRRPRRHGFLPAMRR